MSRTVLITGGAGGLGGAVVAAFADEGWRVVAPVRRAGAEVAGAETVVADLTDAGAVAAAAALAAGDAAAPLRAVVCAAGAFAGGQPVASTPVEDFEAQFAVNVRTAYVTIQAALPHLVAAGGGAIVCVGSRAAAHPFAGAAGYCASKAALETLAAVVAREHRDDGIRCNTIVPGVIDTPANRAAGMTGGVPPAQIARVVRFLCGDEAAATNGAAVPVYPP
ncbi:MAG TPA: SDR family oxidoreductase [Solirubrobacteraceae bacterium]|nr:SDR family oxidoreductase [Solirubrobacteraceae bacterium]